MHIRVFDNEKVWYPGIALKYGTKKGNKKDGWNNVIECALLMMVVMEHGEHGGMLISLLLYIWMLFL